MNSDIELISDGDGLAVIGDAKAVEQFLFSEGITGSKELDLSRLGEAFTTGSAVAQASSEISANYGRWMKLTKESAEAAKKAKVVTNASTGNSHAILRANKGGRFIKNLQFENGIGAIASNPALLSGAAGIMAQLAMQQAMDEITDYLKAIDEKVDDILRAQKDAVFADMIGVDFVIEEAMTIRSAVGRVSEVTWSKVQTTSTTLAKTQGYALRQLDAWAEKLEKKRDVGEIADVAADAESSIQEWLAVLARCFQLQDAVAILELDRVLDTSPEELDRHRAGLQTARRKRLDLIAASTERLLERMALAAATANTKVLLHPAKAPAIVRSSNVVASSVLAFEQPLGIEVERSSTEARKWTHAATEARDKTFVAATDVTNSAWEASSDGLDAALRVGGEGLEKARAATDTLSAGAAKALGGMLSGRFGGRGPKRDSPHEETKAAAPDNDE